MQRTPTPYLFRSTVPTRRALHLLLTLLLWPAVADAQVPGIPEDGDRFGSVLAVGDFNGDGEDDLAIGAPEEAVGNSAEAGTVSVGGWGAASYQYANGSTYEFNQNTLGILGTADPFDRFGSALAAGDFDGDGYDDLAVGVPYENVGTAGNAGVVHILYGSERGLKASGNQVWDQSDLTYTDPEPDDHFGAALTAGDYNGDGFDDLVIASPQEDIGAADEAGVVHVMFGSNAGLTATGNQAWLRERAGHGAPVPFDWFGHALTSGDYNGDGYDDFAASMVGYDAGGAANAGGLIAFYGRASFNLNPGTAVWSQDNLNGAPEPGDQFGFSLASADFDADGFDDLAVGVPYEDDGAVEDAGAVNVIYGDFLRLTATGNQLITQETADVAEGSEPDDRFGYALAAGRIDMDAPADLAVGVEGETLTDSFFDIDIYPLSGTVVPFPGSTGTGLDPTLARGFWRQGRSGVHDRAETGDRFGAALAIGDADGDGAGELAVGVPGEDIDGATDAGAVNVITGGLSGAIDTEGDLLYQGYDLLLSITALDPPPPVVVEQGDRVRFRGSLTRLSARHEGMDYWTDALIPSVVFPRGARVIGPLLGPGTVQVPANGTGSATFTQRVAPNEATGVFEYRLKVGYYPNEVLATAVLPITIISSEGGRVGGDALATRAGAAGLGAFLEVVGPVEWTIDGEAPEAPAPEAASSTLPEAPALLAPRPNPAHGRATLSFSLPEAASVRLSVYDALGREVAVVVDGAREAGMHRAVLDGAGLPSGTYLVRFEAGGAVETQRLTITR